MYRNTKYLWVAVLVITVSYFQNLYAQTITLSSEIIWQEKDLYLLNYDKVKVPFVKFTYQNHTGNSLYFYHYLTNTEKSSYLQFIDGPLGLIHYVEGYFPPDPMTLLMDSFPDWSENEYIVDIEEFKYDGIQQNLYFYKRENKKYYKTKYAIAIWETAEHHILSTLTSALDTQSNLDNEGTNLQPEHFHNPNKIIVSDSLKAKWGEEATNMLNQWHLSETYKLEQLERDSMDRNLYSLGISQRVYHLIEKDILKQCVFLKPYESYSVEYDLTPFFLLKGSYNIIVDKSTAPKSVTVSNKYILWKQYPLNDKRLFNPKRNENYFTYKLPKNYQGYKLFKGKINSVNVELKLEK